MKSRFLACVLLAGLAAGASAQPGGPGRTKETTIERVKKRVRALRAYTLTEELGLDTEGAGRLFPVLAKFDDDFDHLLVARGLLTKALDGVGDFKDPRAVDKLIDQMLANQRAVWELEEKRIAELRKLLTPAQTARLLVVLPALERRIQRQLRNAAQGQSGGPHPHAHRNNPDSATDEDVESDEKPAGPRPVPKQALPKPKPPCDPFASLRAGC